MSFVFFTGAGVPPPSVWPPPPRAPLPPDPPGQYDRVLPFTPPSQPDKLFYRGNFCGVRVPGIPLLPGMAGYTVPPWNQNQAPFCPPIMAQDLMFYWAKGLTDAVSSYFQVYLRDGYTHLQVSVGHAVEAGLSPDQLVAFCWAAKSAGIRFLDFWWLGGGPWGWDSERPDIHPENRDRDWAYWWGVIQPYWQAVLSLMDCCCVGWQLDGYNTADPRQIDSTWQAPIQNIIDGFAALCVPLEIPIGTHWRNEAGAWPSPPNPYGLPVDRFGWWKRQHGELTWFHHQGDVNLDIGTYQAKLVDTLNPFGDGRMGTSGLFGDRPYSLIVYEDSAQAQFNLYMNEDEGDQRGYLLSCTHAASHVGGYGNGARLPDGSVL